MAKHVLAPFWPLVPLKWISIVTPFLSVFNRHQRLTPAGGDHDQLPLVADLIKAEDVHAAVVAFDLDVAIVGSVPLIDHFRDGDSALLPRKASGCSEIGMDFNLNVHNLPVGYDRTLKTTSCSRAWSITFSPKLSFGPTSLTDA